MINENPLTISSSDSHESSINENMNSLKQKVKHGSLWVITSHAGGQLIRFMGNLIMTRLLFAEAFGMMAIVWTFLIGLQLFSDIGIGPGIIQHKRGEDPEYFNTAWSIQVGRGFLLFMAALLGSIPLSEFYGEPMLAMLIPVAASTALIQGFQSTNLFILNRNLNMKRLAIIELTTQIIGLSIMILWGIISGSIWALVIGGIAQTAIKTILSHTMLPGKRNRFHWNREDAHSLFHFGRWIFFSTLLFFAAQQSDRLIFGKMIPLSLLGVYQIGFTLGNIPLEALRQLMGGVFFPVFSRINETNKDLHSIFIQTRWIILVLAGWAFSGLIAGGTAIVDILYDERYSQAGWIVQYISIGCWFSISMESYRTILLARAKTFSLAVANGVKFVAMIILIFIGNKYHGFHGAVLGIVGSELCRLLVIATIAKKVELSAWHQDLVLGLVVTVVSLCGWLADYYLASQGVHVIIRAIAIFILVSVLWAPLILKVYKQFVKRRLQ